MSSENENAIAIIDRQGDVDWIIDEIVPAFSDTSKRDTIKLVCVHPSDQLNVFFLYQALNNTRYRFTSIPQPLWEFPVKPKLLKKAKNVSSTVSTGKISLPEAALNEVSSSHRWWVQGSWSEDLES